MQVRRKSGASWAPRRLWLSCLLSGPMLVLGGCGSDRTIEVEPAAGAENLSKKERLAKNPRVQADLDSMPQAKGKGRTK